VNRYERRGAALITGIDPSLRQTPEPANKTRKFLSGRMYYHLHREESRRLIEVMQDYTVTLVWWLWCR